MKNKILALSLTLLFSSAIAFTSVAEIISHQNNIVLVKKDGDHKDKKSCKTKSCKTKSCKDDKGLESKSSCCSHELKAENCNVNHSKAKESSEKENNKENKQR